MSDRVFICYARKDEDFVLPLATILKDRGVPIWLDQWDIPVTANYNRSIDNAIRDCAKFIVVLSQHSVESTEVEGEWLMALDEKKPILPVLRSPCQVPRQLRAIQRVDFSSWDGSESYPAFKKLVRDLEALLVPAPTKVPERSPRVEESPKAGASQPSLSPAMAFQDTLKDGLRWPKMVVVPAGEFRMGDVHDLGGANEKPVHSVRIAKPFAIGKYPVTFEEYEKYVYAIGLKTPWDQDWGRDRRPVINVSWLDAVKFCEWLSKEAGQNYRLPTEAEWEYAARSGDRDEIWPGTYQDRELGSLAWYQANSGGQTQPVGTKRPNSLRLYDMSGNVWEWVRDCWHENYGGAPTDGSAWEENISRKRVTRGGSWHSGLLDLRASSRRAINVDHRVRSVGFRLAQDLP